MKALLLIDIQNDYFEGGRHAQHEHRLASAARQVDAPREQAGIAAGGVEGGDVAAADEEHPAARGIGEDEVEAGGAHGRGAPGSKRRKVS